jgi:DNA-binding beta-propeller fold protein YncE
MAWTRCALGALLAVTSLGGAAAAGDFVNFESAHVHPLALSPDARWLYAVNTPEARLACFRVRRDGSLRLVDEVPVGLEPVSLALRDDPCEIWVVNHLSDTVGIVDCRSRSLVGTLHVGDEPTDVVLASGRAFVSLSGRDDAVAVYDADTREEVARIPLFGDDPHALAASADGARVYAAVLLSGNATTALHALAKGGAAPPPDPPRDPRLPPAPGVALIVQRDPGSGLWLDDAGGDRSAAVAWRVPDEDLFVIDAAARAPSLLGALGGVGTLLFDVAVRPGSDEVWVPNTEARNLVRFEPNVRGHLVETRITVADVVDGSLAAVDLNPHVDYSISPGPPEEIARSLSQPGDGVFSADGSRFFLTAFGSSLVAEIDADGGEVVRRFRVGGGPSGVALDERGARLYVLSRFENSISTIDLRSGRIAAEMGVAGPARFDPSPESIRLGRRFLYDAALLSGHGDVSCATCHVFGDRDGIAWDLGDPQGEVLAYEDADWLVFGPDLGDRTGFDPMKGPMTTQTLRGLRGMEPFHWRGDRRNFQHFNGAFVSLLGRAEPLPEADMDLFADFAMTLALPPNPNRGADDSLPERIAVPDPDAAGALVEGDPAAGAALFASGAPNGQPGPCTDCHAPPAGTLNTIQFSRGRSQDFKIPHLRNVYEKLGRDRVRPAPGGGPDELAAGFGLLNDGILSLMQLLANFGFERRDQIDLAAFVRTFPTGTPACVGRQLGVDAGASGAPATAARLAVLVAAADAGLCDLVAHGSRGRRREGYVYDPALGAFLPDRAGGRPRGAGELLGSIRRADVITWTAVPAGSGRRLGIDRDRDGCLDRDEPSPAAAADPSSCSGGG